VDFVCSGRRFEGDVAGELAADDAVAGRDDVAAEAAANADDGNYGTVAGKRPDVANLRFQLVVRNRVKSFAHGLVRALVRFFAPYDSRLIPAVDVVSRLGPRPQQCADSIHDGTPDLF